MSKSKSRIRRRRPARESARPELDVVSQLQCAARNPGAAALGAAVGGIVPWFAREIAHREIPTAWASGGRWLAGALLVVVAGCAVFSVLTVYKFGRAAFGSDARKAAGFCAAIEGVMLVATGTVGIVALAALVAINAIVNGCSIALAHEATTRRREADGRRQATRASNRARSAAVRTAARPTGGQPAPEVPEAIEPTDRVAVRAPAAWSRRRKNDDAVDAEAVYS